MYKNQRRIENYFVFARIAVVLVMQEQRKIGVVLNYVNLVLRIISSFWVTRVIVSTLGVSEYGLISLAGSVLVLLPLLDFGMTTAITRFGSEYRANGDMEGLRNFLGLCQKFFYGIALLTGVICFCLYFQLDAIFPKLTAEELQKTKVMFIMLSCGSVINFTQCLYTNLLGAFQQYLVMGLLGTFTLLFTAVGSILFVWNGYGAIGVTAVGLCLHMVKIFPARLYCWKKLKIMPNLAYWDWALMKKSMGYSMWVFCGMVSSMVGENLAPLIIGSTCGSTESGIFRIGTILTGYIIMGASVSSVFFPKVVEMVTHRAGRKELTEIFTRIGRIDFTLALLLVGGFFVFGRDFLLMWLKGNEEMAMHTERAWQVGMLCSLFIPVGASFGIGWQILNAKNLLKFRTIVSLICNLVASGIGYLLALNYGMFGLLWTRFAIPGVLLTVFTLFYFEKIVDLDMKYFMKKAWLVTLLPFVLAAMSGLLIIYCCPVSSWVNLIIQGSVFTIIYVLSSWMMVMNASEKRIVIELLSKLIKPIFGGGGK